jgi:hypothetical protein
MIVPSCFSLHRSILRRFANIFAGDVPIAESGGKAPNFTQKHPIRTK